MLRAQVRLGKGGVIIVNFGLTANKGTFSATPSASPRPSNSPSASRSLSASKPAAPGPSPSKSPGVILKVGEHLQQRHHRPPSHRWTRFIFVPCLIPQEHRVSLSTRLGWEEERMRELEKGW